MKRPRFYREIDSGEIPASPVDPLFIDHPASFLDASETLEAFDPLEESSEVRNTGFSDSRFFRTYGFSGSLAARTRERAGACASRPATEEELGVFLQILAEEADGIAPGHWKRGFGAVRALRSRPELRHLREDPDAALEAVEAVAPPGWFERIFGGDDPHLTFVYQWSRVRLDLDEDPLLEAVEKTRGEPVSLPSRGRLSPTVQLIGSIASYRSATSGGTFALPQPQLAEMTGLVQGTISKAINDLIRRGFLKEVPRPEEDKGRAKLYSYHGPAPKTLPVPELPPLSPEKVEEPESPSTAPPENLPKWTKTQVDAAWKGWKPKQRKLYREVYDRNKPGEAFEGEAASLAMDAVLAKGEPVEEDIILPQKGKPFHVSRAYLEELRAKHPTLNVREEIRKLDQKIQDKGEEIGWMRLYLEKWLQNAERDAPRWKMCREVQAGDPVDGAYNDDRTKRWSSFNRSWTEAKNWTSKDEMLRVYTDLMNEAYP